MSKDGGSAFPRLGFWEPVDCKNERGEVWSVSQKGMTMRDYFAGEALKGILASYANLNNIANTEACAKEAFDRADAMLKEREK